MNNNEQPINNNTPPAERTAELVSVLRSIHTHRFERLQGSGLAPALKSTGYNEVNETFFYVCWCSNEAQPTAIPLVQQIVHGSDTGIRDLVNSRYSTYCILTTSNQYTVAGPLWVIAVMHAFYLNKVELLDSILSDIDLSEEVTVFCPLEGEGLQKSYMAQPLAAVMLMSSDLANIRLQTFELLLDKIQPNASLAWDEFSTSLKTTGRRSGLLEILLLEKMITQGKTDFAVSLIKRNPGLLRAQSTQGNLTLLELIVKKDQFQILDNATTDARPVIEVVDEIVPELLNQGSNATLDEAQKRRLGDWRGAHNRTPKLTPARMCAVMGINFFFTAVAFLGAVAFAGVGEKHIKNVLIDAGVPTGPVPAIIAVLVASSISVVLTERGYGLIDKQTTGSFLLSAIFPMFPTPPGGPRTQDSLGNVERSKATAEGFTAIIMCSIIGIGMILISQLPKWSATCAALPAYQLVIAVTVAAAVLNALIIPPICKSLYDYLATPEDKGK